MYELKKSYWQKHLDFLILDMAVLSLLYLALVLVMHDGTDGYSGMTGQARMHMAFLIPVICIIMALPKRYYNNILKRSRTDEFVECTKYMCMFCACILFYLFVSRDAYLFSRLLLIFFWAFGIIALWASRTFFKKIAIRSLIKHNSIVLVSDDEDIETCIEELHVAIFTAFTYAEPEGVLHFPLSISAFEEYRETHVIDKVVLDIHDKKEKEAWIKYLLLSGLPVHITVNHMYTGLPNAVMETLGEVPVLTASPAMTSPQQLFLKRVMDIMGGIVGMVITGIAFLIFAPIIKKQSPGPVFYKQTRIGRNGRRFTMVKFRSMYPDADKRKAELAKDNKIDGYMFKIDKDPRIIPIGHFMRKHSIDELPQFWNVLKGDMALVGTRPPTLDEWEQYSPHHRARLSAKPGLTGVWQVSGRSNITDFEEVVQMDTDYIKNWSIFSDIKLILKTVLVVFHGEGAE